jgi:hypothetical protein
MASRFLALPARETGAVERPVPIVTLPAKKRNRIATHRPLSLSNCLPILVAMSRRHHRFRTHNKSVGKAPDAQR